MIASANQLYRESNSDLPFKEWLKSQQKDGVLDTHEKMFNADGDGNKKITTKKAKEKNGMLNLIGLISLGVLIYGLTKTSASE